MIPALVLALLTLAWLCWEIRREYRRALRETGGKLQFTIWGER